MPPPLSQENSCALSFCIHFPFFLCDFSRLIVTDRQVRFDCHSLKFILIHYCLLLLQTSLADCLARRLTTSRKSEHSEGVHYHNAIVHFSLQDSSSTPHISIQCRSKHNCRAKRAYIVAQFFFIGERSEQT